MNVNVIVVGLNHKKASVELRELLMVPDSRIGEALKRLMAHPSIREGVFLQTCNRVEVYAVTDHADNGISGVKEFLVDTHLSLSAEQLPLYELKEYKAIEHLFCVASSLDSLVVGEPQILGQVKKCFRDASTHNASGVILNKVFQKAISVAKRVRTETRIAENAVSVSYAAVELAKKVFGSLSERTVMLVGAGEMAKLAAQHLVDHGVQQVFLTTRDSLRARDMANRFHGTPMPFEEFRTSLYKADIVLCSTGAPHYVIGPDDVEHAVRKRWNRPIFLIDVAVPRNIDPAVRQVDNAFLFNMDDLAKCVERNRDERQKEADCAKDIVEGEVGTMRRWMQAFKATPMIIDLRKHAEDIKHAELQQSFGRLGTLTPEEAMEHLTSGIVKKLLHRSFVALRSVAQMSNGSMYREAARHCYGSERHLVVQDSVDVRGPVDRKPSGGDGLPSASAPESEREKVSE